MESTTMSTETTRPEISSVEIVRVRTRAELHKHYDGQTKTQDCYVELNCRDRLLHADWNCEIGNAVPAAVWHGHTRRWGIATLTADAANDLLDEIAPLAERVCDGYERDWDGNNHVARFSADALAAMDEIERLCERAGDDPSDCVQEWDAAEWLHGIGSADRQRAEYGITAATTDDELRAIESRIETEARADDVDVLHGLERHLEWLRRDAPEIETDETDGE